MERKCALGAMAVSPVDLAGITRPPEPDFTARIQVRAPWSAQIEWQV
jgi:hypothetical protein